MGIRRRLRYSEVRSRNNIKGWKDRFLGIPVFIIGNSCALNDENMSILEPYFTIGINRAFYKIDPTILFWQDVELWTTERKKILKLNSIKVCRDKADPQNRFFHYKLNTGNFGLPQSPNSLYGTGTTGPLAVQFAYSLGCDPIIMLGMDCQRRGSSTDFYGRNIHYKSYTLENCKNGLVWIKQEIATKRTVINCSVDNKHFEYNKVDDVVSQLSSDFAQHRSYWVSKLS